VSRVPAWLALNATAQFTTGALLQVVDGALHIIADWVNEGDPGQSLQGLVASAGVVAGRGLACFALPEHFGNYDTVGLRGAAAAIPCDVRPGGPALAGRDQIRRLLARTIHGRAALQVGTQARWTLNALSGGYCFEITKHGTLSDFTKPGAYRTLLEGIESVAALLAVGVEDEADRRTTVTNGVRHLTALATGETTRPSKSDWGVLLSQTPRR